MKKYSVISFILFLSISQMSGINFSDPSWKKDLKEWELVKTVQVPKQNIEIQKHVLITTTNPYKLTLKDDKGNIFWTKTNLRSEFDWVFFERNAHKRAIKDYNRIPNGYKVESTSDYETLDINGNCLLMDTAYNRYVFVDKQGNETYLPPNSASLDFLGLFDDKYLMFYQMDSLDFVAQYKDDPDLVEIPKYPKFDNTIKYTDLKNWCGIFNKSGSLVKEFTLPDVVDINQNSIYFDENMNYLAYETYTKGCILMKTSGEVIKNGGHLPLLTPVFSEDGKLWIPNTQTQDVEILDIKTGRRVFILEGPWSNGSAISDEETGYLLYTKRGYTSLIDYKNSKQLFFQQDENARFSDPWISGNGKEIRFTYKAKDKPAEVKYYRMSNQGGK